MNRSYLFCILVIFLFLGCSSDKPNPIAPSETKKNGNLIINVTWPQKAFTSKNTNILRDAPDKITAYIYLAGKEVTRADLKHEGTRGTAEITIGAQSGYKLEMIAYDESFNQVLYVGLKENITIVADTTTAVDITMVDASPLLYQAQTIDESSYVISWSPVPIATSYLLEESSSTKFNDDRKKLSTTIYAGSDTTKTLTNKTPGTYFYCVFAVTQYCELYVPSQANEDNFDFYIAVKYGAMSNVIAVQSGATGSLKMDIPWPLK